MVSIYKETICNCFLVTFPLHAYKYSLNVQNLVQILLLGQHWVCISTVGCPTGTVKLFDSACPAGGTKYFSTPRGEVLAKQLAVLFNDTHREVTVEVVSCTQQRGATDCGLFAAAFATALCLGQGLDTAQFVQSKMRTHLVLCFENLNITGFPQGRMCNSTARRQFAWREELRFICICRQPWLLSGEPVVLCSKCNSEYHLSCIGRKNTRAKAWICYLCV